MPSSPTTRVSSGGNPAFVFPNSSNALSTANAGPQAHHTSMSGAHTHGGSSVSSPTTANTAGAFPQPIPPLLKTNSAGSFSHLPTATTQAGKHKGSDLFEWLSDIKELYAFPEGGLRGTGGFGRVVHAQRPDGSHCALKVVGKQHGTRADLVKETIFREVMALKAVSHPNIVAFNGAFDTPNAYYLDFELCTEDIFMYMKLGGRTPIVFSESDTSLIVRQLADALAFLHHRNMAHLDVKLENILINAPNDVRLADFGFARQLSLEESPCMVTNGSGLYTPPEILKAQLRQDEATRVASPTLTNACITSMDMWCLGVVTYLLLSARPPYRTRVASRADREDMLRKINSGLEFPEQRWGSVTPCARDFISKLLVEDPCKRMTAVRALEHPFLHTREDVDWSPAGLFPAFNS